MTADVNRPSYQFMMNKIKTLPTVFLMKYLVSVYKLSLYGEKCGLWTLLHVNSQQKHVLTDRQSVFKFLLMNLNKACHFLPNSQLRKPHRSRIQRQVIIMIIRKMQRLCTQAYMQEQWVMIASQVWSRMCSRYSWITHLWHTYRAHKEINNRNIWDSLPEGSLSSPRKAHCNWGRQNNWWKLLEWESGTLFGSVNRGGAAHNYVLIVNVDCAIEFIHILCTVKSLPGNTSHLVS